MSNALFALVEASSERGKPNDGTMHRDLSATSLSELEKLLENDVLPALPLEKLAAADAIAPDLKSDAVEKRPLFPDLKAKVESNYERTLDPLKVVRRLAAFDAYLQITSVSSNFATSDAEIVLTFSHPMVFVPLSHLLLKADEQTAKKLPFTSGVIDVQPQLGGYWNWVTENQLQFLPEPLKPGLELTITVVQIESCSGNKLIEPSRHTFHVPGVNLEKHFPVAEQKTPTRIDEFVDPDCVICLKFDQAVDPAVVLSSIVMSVESSPQVNLSSIYFSGPSLALVSFHDAELHYEDYCNAAEATNVQAILNDYKESPKNRWVFFRAATPLPMESRIRVSFTDASTGKSQSFVFRTYGPLRVYSIDKRLVLRGKSNDVFANKLIAVKLTNPIDVSSFSPTMIYCDPDIFHVNMQPTGEIQLALKLDGPLRFECEISFLDGIKDMYNQYMEPEIIKISGRHQYALTTKESDMILHNPQLKPVTFPFSTNFEEILVSIYQVKPSLYESSDSKTWLYGADLVHSETVRPKLNAMKELKEVQIDLQEYLQFPKENIGHLVVTIEPTTEAMYSLEQGIDREQFRLVSWIQSTHFAIVGFQSTAPPVAWITSLHDAKAVGQVNADWGSWLAADSLWYSIGFGNRIQTDNHGIVALPLPKASLKFNYHLIATKGNEVSFLPHVLVYPAPDQLSICSVSDKPFYYPGDLANVVFWIRELKVENGNYVGLALLGDTSLSYSVEDEQGEPVSAGVVNCHRGSLAVQFRIPSRQQHFLARKLFVNLLKDSNRIARHTAVIRDAPKFLIAISKSQQHSGSGDRRNNNNGMATTFLSVNALVKLSAQIRYNDFNYHPVIGGKLKWTVSAYSIRFHPRSNNYLDRLDEFSFWPEDNLSVSDSSERKFLDSSTHHSAIDNSGNSAIDLSVNSSMHAIEFEVAVDLDDSIRKPGQTQSSPLITHKFICHSQLYIGLKRNNVVAKVGDTLSLSIAIADPNGLLLPQMDIVVELALIVRDALRAIAKEVPIGSSQFQSRAAPVLWESTPIKEFGEYRVTVTCASQQNSAVFMVFPPTYQKSLQFAESGEENIAIFPNRKYYVPGDKAIIRAVFSHDNIQKQSEVICRVVTNMENQQILPAKREGCIAELVLEITETMIPLAKVSFLQFSQQLDSKLSVLSQCEIDIDVRPHHLMLTNQIEVDCPNMTEANLCRVTTSIMNNGQTVENAEVDLFLFNVDESDDQLGLDYNYGLKLLNKLYPFKKEYGLRTIDRKIDSPTTGTPEQDTTLNFIFDEFANPNSIEAWEFPFSRLTRLVQTTSKTGQALFNFGVPQNATRFAVVAISSWRGHYFGCTVRTFRNACPLQIVPRLPQSLRVGEVFKVRVELKNRSDETQKIECAIVVNDQVDMLDPATELLFPKAMGYEVELPPRCEYVLDLWIVAKSFGKCTFGLASRTRQACLKNITRFDVLQASEALSNVSYFLFPSESQAYHPVAIPTHSTHSKLSIFASPSPMIVFYDLVKYFFSKNPFHRPASESLEYISSKLIIVCILLKELETLFHDIDDVPSYTDSLNIIAADLNTLLNLQYGDGSFSVAGVNDVFISIHVAHAVARIHNKKNNGVQIFRVPKLLLDRCSLYLVQVTAQLGSDSSYLPHLTNKVKCFLRTYAIYVRWLLFHEIDAVRDHMLADYIDVLTPETVALLLSCGKKEIPSKVQSILFSTIRAIQQKTFSGECDANSIIYAHETTVRSSALILNCLIDTAGDQEAITTLIRYISGFRLENGRWRSPTEMTFVILALWKFNINLYKDSASAKNSQLSHFYFDNAHVLTLNGRSWLDCAHCAIPPKQFQDSFIDSHTLSFSKTGKGLLQYRLEFEYELGEAEGTAHGRIAIDRYLYSPTGSLKKDSAGHYYCDLGAVFQVYLRVRSKYNCHHVYLNDYFPSMFEVIGDKPANSPWHLNSINSSRLELYTSVLPAGTYLYSYWLKNVGYGSFRTQVYEQYGQAQARTCSDTLFVAASQRDGLEPATLVDRLALPEQKTPKKPPQLHIKPSLFNPSAKSLDSSPDHAPQPLSEQHHELVSKIQTWDTILSSAKSTALTPEQTSKLAKSPRGKEKFNPKSPRGKDMKRQDSLKSKTPDDEDYEIIL